MYLKITNLKVTTYIQSRAATWHETCNVVNTKIQYMYVEVVD